MFGIGMQELIVILVVALLIFGPTKLPELARSLGRSLAEFRRASSDLRQSLTEAIEEPRAEKQPPKPSTTVGAAPGEPEAGELEERVGPAPAPSGSAADAGSADSAEPSQVPRTRADSGEERPGG